MRTGGVQILGKEVELASSHEAPVVQHRPANQGMFGELDDEGRTPFFSLPPPLFSFFSEINTNVHLLGGGLLLNAKGRVSLMKRLQRDEEKPPAPKAPPPAPTPAPVVPMPCLFLSNMFDPAEETNPNFHVEIQEDVQGECGRFGQVLHLFVDPNSKVFESSIRFDS